jgi:hypothetical protein
LSEGGSCLGVSPTLPQTLHHYFFYYYCSSLPIYYILININKYIRDKGEGVEGVEGCVEVGKTRTEKVF